MTRQWLPVGPLRVQLHGYANLGLDVARLHHAIGPIPDDPNAQVPTSAYLALWEAALTQYNPPCLPTALARVIPFGAFGVLDYLVGSSEKLGASCESLALHFDIVANDIRFELESSGMHRWIHLRADVHVPVHAIEFTLAIVVTRLQHMAHRGFALRQVHLVGPAPIDDAMHQQAFLCPVVYGAPVAGFCIAAADWDVPITRADAYLHATLKSLAAQMHLGQPETSGLEQAVRARLRDALPAGDASPAQLARLLGLSERTLQRRLAGAGRSFSVVVEEFRHEEAVRLLSDSKLALAQIAGALGFSEQTSFTRAFKRWTSMTPAAWRAQQRLTGS